MDSVDEIMQLCRLCLVKDEVNTPIFEEEGDIRQIFLKISACLPVKVSKEDNLPKNICDGCSCKLEALYQFWNTSANSEKKLMKWLSQGGIIDKSVSDKHSMNIDPVILKQEVVEVPDDRHSPDDDLVSSDLNVSNDADEYLIQQQQLPYQNVEFQFQQDEFDQTGTDPIIAETGTPSRKRRAAAIRAMANMGTEEEANPDLLEPKIAKTEEESEDSCNEDPEPTTFVGLPSATDNEQAGPSGVGKPAADPPYTVWQLYKVVKVPAPTDNVKLSPPPTPAPETIVPTPTVNLSCPKCDKTFNNKQKLFKHKSYVHNSKLRYPCEVCGKLFRTFSAATYHVDVHNPEKTYACDICGKSYSHKQSLKLHKTKVHTSGRFKCEKCDKSFYYKAELDSHTRKVHLGVTYTCPECNKVYVDEKYYKIHRKTHQPGYAPRTFTCVICKAKYTGKQGYNKHIKKHGVQPPKPLFICDTCGIHIVSLSSFKNHLRLHSGEKPFKCNDCGKEFAAKAVLRTHVRVHTKEKPFSCTVCLKHFTQRSTLTIHMRQHTGERPYKCDICQKAFAGKSMLKSHLKAHSRYPKNCTST